MYYVNYPGNNLKHSTGGYKAKLKYSCSKMHAQGRRTTIIGDAKWVYKNVPECRPMMDNAGKHGLTPVELSYDDLRYNNTNIKADCRLKWGGRAPHGMEASLARIWLSKARSLCKGAMRRPTKRSFIMDTGAALEQKLQGPLGYNVRTSVGVLLYENDPLLKKAIEHRPYWFGRTYCTKAPKVIAKLISVRGDNCPRLMAAYEKAYEEARTNTTCSCFDEEMVLTRAREENPHLFVNMFDEVGHLQLWSEEKRR